MAFFGVQGESRSPEFLEDLVQLENRIMPGGQVDDHFIEAGGSIIVMGMEHDVCLWNIAGALCSLKGRTQYCQCPRVVPLSEVQSQYKPGYP